MKKIMMLKYLVIVFIAIMFSVSNIFCQSAKEPASGYLLENQLEYITFFTDRDFYLSGETIWFSAQCLLKENHKASTFSNVLYLELFNTENKSFRRDKFDLISGQVSASIQISEEIPTGNYFLRVYTQYLRNFGYDACFMQCINVINPETPIPQTQSIANDSIEIVPDGIAMIRNLPSRIAIKIPEKVMQQAEAFYIEEQDQLTVGRIEPSSNGLAEISFTPKDSSAYFLKIVMKSGELRRIAFPLAVDTGFSILATIEDHALVCEIACSTGLSWIADRFRLILIHQDDSGFYETDLLSGQLLQTIRISEQYLKNGLNYLVIKDNKNQVYQFKTLFLTLDEFIPISVNLQKNSFHPRELIEVNLSNFSFESGDSAKLSVSVIKSGTLQDWNEILPLQYIENPEMITPELLLNNQPNQVLIKQAEIALMLNKAKSLKIIDKKLDQKFYPLVFLPEIREVSISGMVREKNTGNPASGVQVFVAVLFRNFQIHSMKTHKDGSFIFSLYNLTGMHDLFLYASQNADRELELFINTDFSDEYPIIHDWFVPPDESAKQLIEELWINHQVSNSFNNETKILAESKNLPFIFGNEMNTILLKDYINLSTLKEVFQEIVPSVILHETGGHFHFSVFDKKTEMIFRDPLLLLDQVPVLNPDDMMNIHPSQVESIGVISKVYVLGNNTYQGVISVKTKNRDFGGINFPAGSAFAEYQTITPAASFKVKNYDQSEFNDKHAPDFRTLLYWNPEFTLISDSNRIKFNASDYCSDYDIIVRGFTKSGKYCYGKSALKVEKGVSKE